MSSTAAPTYRLYVIGYRELRGPGDRRITSVLAQPKRLSLLTYLCAAGRPVSRGELAACFWPDSDEAHARNALSQAVFHLRRSLGKSAVVAVEGDLLQVPAERVWCDVRAVLAGASSDPRHPRAGSDQLLEGWNADDSHPLQEWLDRTRERVRSTIAAAEPDWSSATSDGVGTSQVASPGRERIGLTSPGHGGVGDPDDEAETRRHDPAAPASRSGRGRAIRVPWLGGAAASLGGVALALVVFMRVSLGTPSMLPVANAGTEVVLVTPVFQGDDVGDSFQEAVRIELLAALSDLPGISVFSVEGTAAEARRDIEAVGEPAELKWFLEVVTYVDDGRARLLTVLSEGNRAEQADVESIDLGTADRLHVEGPIAIGRTISRMVAGGLSGH